MQVNPIEEWQRLTDLYREMNEGELLDLAADFTDLTETAQQVLRDEMKKRGLAESRAADEAANHADHPEAGFNPPATVHWELSRHRYDPRPDQEDDDLPHEYTWKTLLCECEDTQQAWQLAEALRRAGIESWIEQPGQGWVIGGPRILVAADQLDQAREIAAQPIPQEIIDQSKAEPPEFKLPVCPQCGAEDPLLEGVDPVNSWRCESCGMQWTDAAGEIDEKDERYEKTGP
jgi:hypothetical protein